MRTSQVPRSCPNTHNAACGIETRRNPREAYSRHRPNTHYAACGIETRFHRQGTTPFSCPNTYNAACGFVQIGVGHKKALHLPLGEHNAFRMQLIRHRVLTQIHTNDRIEIQKGHCLAVAPITSEISPPGFGRRKAGFSLLSFHGYNQHGEHYEKREKFVGFHTNLPLSRGQDSTALSTVLAFSIA